MFVHNQQEKACETVCRLFMIQKHSSLALAFKNGDTMYETRKCETPERMRLADQSQSLRAGWGRRRFYWIVTNFGGRTYVLCNCAKGLATALMYLTCLRFYVKSEYK